MAVTPFCIVECILQSVEVGAPLGQSRLTTSFAGVSSGIPAYPWQSWSKPVEGRVRQTAILATYFGVSIRGGALSHIAVTAAFGNIFLTAQFCILPTSVLTTSLAGVSSGIPAYLWQSLSKPVEGRVRQTAILATYFGVSFRDGAFSHLAITAHLARFFCGTILHIADIRIWGNVLRWAFYRTAQFIVTTAVSQSSAHFVIAVQFRTPATVIFNSLL